MAIGIKDPVERVSGLVLKKGDIVYHNFQIHSAAYECLGFRKTLGRWKFRELSTGVEFTTNAAFLGLYTWKPLLPLKKEKSV